MKRSFSLKRQFCTFVVAGRLSRCECGPSKFATPPVVEMWTKELVQPSRLSIKTTYLHQRAGGRGEEIVV